MTQTSAKKVFRWADLPKIDLLGGTMARSAFRSDGCLLSFNRIEPTMQRWEPHTHPFDQIVLTLQGRLMLEVDGEAVECPPGSIARVPGNVPHTGWPIGDEPVLNIDVFAPPRPDYLFLVDYQKEYVQPADGDIPQAYHQLPSAASFAGTLMSDPSEFLFRWQDMPAITGVVGATRRAGFRGDDCLLTFNWIGPEIKRAAPQSHPFDRIVLTVEGMLMLEVGRETMECGPGTVTRVPAGAMHTRWPIGSAPVLNIDVFAPPREDYLDLVTYQKEFSSRRP